MSFLCRSKTQPVSQPDRHSLEGISARFPSFQLFYKADPKALLNTANSLSIMDHLVDGSKKDYYELTCTQQNDTLTLESFCHLCGFFYDFRINQELRRELELFILLDGISRTEAGESLIRVFPSNQSEQISRDFLALSIINLRLLAEIRQLDAYSAMTLQRAFAYRQFITGRAPGHTIEFTNDVTHIAQAGVICDIAGLSADPVYLGSSQLLTESMAKRLLDYIDNREQLKIASEFCSLTAS